MSNCRRELRLDDFSLFCMGSGYAVDSLAIEIGHRQARMPMDAERTRLHLEHVREFFTALIAGEEASRSASFSRDAIVNGQLHEVFEQAKSRVREFRELKPEEVLALLNRFEELDEGELWFLHRYLNEVGKLLINNGP